MAHYDYPSYAEHIQDHKQLLNKLLEIVANIQSEEWQPTDLMVFMRTQLLVHIFEVDMMLC
jgi:hemerythrin